MLSKIWLIPWSVSRHCCFESSLVVFENQVTKQQAEHQVQHGPYGEHRNLFEILDCTPEEEQSILQSMRSLYD